MTRKIISIAMGLALISCLLAGCASKDVTENQGETNKGETAKEQESVISGSEAPDTVYVPHFSDVKYDADIYNPAECSYMFVQGDSLYSLSQVYDEGMKLNVQKLELSTGVQSEAVVGKYMNSYYRTPGGYIGCSESDRILKIYDNEFNVKQEVDLTILNNLLKSENAGFFVTDCGMDSQGNIGLLVGGNLYVLDGEGNVKFSIGYSENAGQFYKLGVTADDGMYVWGYDSSYSKVAYRVDMAGQCLAQKMENLPVVSFDTIIYPMDVSSLYLVTVDGIYTYDTVTQLCRQLIKLTDYGITIGKYASTFGKTGDGTLTIINKTNEYETVDGVPVMKTGLEMVSLEEVMADEVQLRRELTLATVGEPAVQYKNAVLKFNKYNSDYFITIKDYTDEVEGEPEDKWDIARQRFNQDLITGQGADIFMTNGGNIDFRNLSEKGALMDLYEFIDGDEEIGREDFIPNILAALEYDGKLYRATDSFYLMTILGKTKFLDGYTKLDLDTAAQLAEKYSDMLLFPSGNSMWSLRVLVMYYMDAFYDSVTGECSFSSPEFVKLLELAKSFPTQTETTSMSDEVELINEDKALLWQGVITSKYDITINETLLGEDITYIGYPTTAESGNMIAFNNCFAISAMSENKAEAWEFVRTFLTKEWMENCSGLSLRTDAFENMLNSEGGNMSYGLDGMVIDIDSPTEEQKQMLRDIVYSAAATSEYDAEIYSIIEEEAQSFLDGPKSAEEVAGIIQSRVQLYIDENR